MQEGAAHAVPAAAPRLAAGRLAALLHPGRPPAHPARCRHPAPGEKINKQTVSLCLFCLQLLALLTPWLHGRLGPTSHCPAPACCRPAPRPPPNTNLSDCEHNKWLDNTPLELQEMVSSQSLSTQLFLYVLLVPIGNSYKELT